MRKENVEKVIGSLAKNQRDMIGKINIQTCRDQMKSVNKDQDKEQVMNYVNNFTYSSAFANVTTPMSSKRLLMRLATSFKDKVKEEQVKFEYKRGVQEFI